ncbi:MAG: TraC family protein [Candidatus Omnitrophica bacterium]|nr:TraC family protein [Candidatus Omnitrophota bacterium]
MTRVKTEDMKRIFDEKLSLVDYLPYGEYVDGVFLNVDGSLGRVWELTPFESELAGEAGLKEMSNAASGLVGSLSKEFQCQMILFCDSEVAPALLDYQKRSSGSDNLIVNAVIDGKVRHILEANNQKNQGENVMPRRIRVFFTVKMTPHWISPSAGSGFLEYFSNGKIISDRIAAEWRRHREDFLRAVESVENRLSAFRIPHTALNKEALARLLYRFLNPVRARSIPKTPAGDDFIREGVLYHAPEARGEGFVLDGWHTRVVSLKELPSQTLTGMFSTETLAGGSKCLVDILSDFVFVLNFVVPDQSEALERLKFQKTFAFMQRSGSSGDVSEEAVYKKEELSAVISETFKSGQPIVYTRAHFVLLSASEHDVERACDSLLSALHGYGAEGLKEEIIAPSLFLTCLPLNFDFGLENFIKRTKRLLCDNFADMLPLYGSFHGTPTPAALYLNRRGEPVFVDFFDSETNPHGVIIGASGAGKSFLTNDFIYQNYRLGSRFFVLDKGNSYQKTCEILSGQYIAFDMAKPLTINPFFRTPSNENLAFLIEVLSLMASGGDDRDRLTREEKGFLQLAAIETYDRKPLGEVVLSDLVAVLNDEAFAALKNARAGMGPGLALRLASFTKNGQFGEFFDGPNQFDVEGRFTVFELGNLSAYPDLQLVVLLNVMFFITQFVAAPEARGERKFLLIDEAWQLLKMSNTAEFITNAFKTFRKYRCSAVAVTQEVADLLQQKSGLAILANSANKIFLKQEPALIDRLKAELSFTDQIAASLKSVRTVKGKYSEALVLTSSSSGVARLVPDPFLYWVATSDAKDNEYLNEAKRASNGDLLAALAHCAKEHPYGVR